MAAHATGQLLQVIEGHNLDPYRLIKLLENVYGPCTDGDKFSVEVRISGIRAFVFVLTAGILQLRLNRYNIYVSSDVPNRQALSHVGEYSSRNGELWSLPLVGSNLGLSSGLRREQKILTPSASTSF